MRRNILFMIIPLVLTACVNQKSVNLPDDIMKPNRMVLQRAESPAKPMKVSA